jgi:hypothetical protein
MAAALEVRCAHFTERGERLFGMIENHEHHDLRGPAAGEAQTRLENLQRTAYTGSVVTDRRRLIRMMRRASWWLLLGQPGRQFQPCVQDRRSRARTCTRAPAF